MTDQQTLREDIAFLRTLAEEGRETPLVGGDILLSAGLIYAACSFATWAAAVTNWPPAASPWFMPILWFGGTALFMALLFAFKARMPVQSANSRAAGLVWAGSGWAVFVVVLSLMIMGYRANAWWIMAGICPVVLATYGAAWTVGGLLSRRSWMRLVGLGAFAMALVCAWFGQQVETLFALYGVSLLALVALPGLVLMRQSRQG
ncbi:MAG: hypothetical protein ACHQ7M_19350 [Chloroflexota bacterium]